jgi:hypothetical protein
MKSTRMVMVMPREFDQGLCIAESACITASKRQTVGESTRPLDNPTARC